MKSFSERLCYNGKSLMVSAMYSICDSTISGNMGKERISWEALVSSEK